MAILIPVSVQNRRARLIQPASAVVCGNAGYRIFFLYDSEWTKYPVIMARFAWYEAGQPRFADVPVSGWECPVPVLHRTNALAVGLWAGSIQTSASACIPCLPCITDPQPPPLPRYTDVYRQLTEILCHIPHQKEGTAWN